MDCSFTFVINAGKVRYINNPGPSQNLASQKNCKERKLLLFYTFRYWTHINKQTSKKDKCVGEPNVLPRRNKSRKPVLLQPWRELGRPEHPVGEKVDV